MPHSLVVSHRNTDRHLLNKWFGLIAIIFCLLLSLGTYVSLVNSSPSQESYTWLPGQGVLFQLSAETEIDMRVSDGQPFSQLKQTIDADLSLKIISVDQDQVVALLQLQRSHVRENEQEDPDLNQFIESEFIVHLAKDGTLSSYDFPQSLSSSEQERLRGLTQSLQFVVHPKFQYQTHEQDSLGSFRALYSRSEQGINRQIQSYTSLKSNLPGSVIRLIRAESTARLNPQGPWLDTLENNFQAEIYQSKSIQAKLKNRFKLSLKAVLQKEQPQPYADILARFAKQANQSTLSFEQKLNLRQRLKYEQQGVNLSSLVSQVSQPLSPDQLLAAKDKLEDYLQVFPEKIRDLELVLSDASLEVTTGQAMIYAVQQIGIPEAQKTLQLLAESDKYTTAFRLQAILGLGSLTQPDQSSEDSLWKIAQQGSPELADSARMMLGLQSKTLANSDPQRAQKIFQKLKQDFNEAKKAESDSAANRFRALANTARPEVLSIAQELFSGPQVRWRVLAVEASATLEQADVDLQLASNFEQQQPESVREALAIAFLERPVNTEIMNAVQSRILSEPAVEVRLLLARYLLKYAQKFPANNDILRELAARETDPRVYQVAIEGII